MTEDTSPENLRKFLESDDPALVRMGLSMAKGSGVPDEILGEILWMYMMHDDATIRAAAKSTFIKIAPEDAKQVVKEPKYRTLKGKKYAKAIRPLVQASNSQDYLKNIIWRLAEPVITEAKIDIDSNSKRLIRKNSAIESLGDFGNIAIKPLISILEDHQPFDKWDIEWEDLEDLDIRDWEIAVDQLDAPNVIATKVLGEMGDKRAVEPLIRELERGNVTALGALMKLGHKPKWGSKYYYI